MVSINPINQDMSQKGRYYRDILKLSSPGGKTIAAIRIQKLYCCVDRFSQSKAHHLRALKRGTHF